MEDPKELIEDCKKHLRSTASFKHEYKKDIRKLITALEKAINYSQCCMGETELDEDVSVNIEHKSLGKFNLVKKQDSETEQLSDKPIDGGTSYNDL